MPASEIKWILNLVEGPARIVERVVQLVLTPGIGSLAATVVRVDVRRSASVERRTKAGRTYRVDDCRQWKCWLEREVRLGKNLERKRRMVFGNNT